MNEENTQEERSKCHCGEKNCKSEENTQVKEKEIIIEKNLDYKDKYLRILADNENTRKRMQKEKHETIRFAIENTVSEFLPALDNFENALKFSQSSSEEVKNWATGFQMILTQFRDVMHNHGIVAYHSEGNIFDPHFHEAMEIVETDKHPDGTILEEYAKGYKSQNRTIRPAKVKVAKNIKETSQENTISPEDEEIKD